MDGNARREMLGKLCSVLMLLALMSGCSSMGNRARPTGEHLTKAVQAFNNAIRWQDYPIASALLHPSLKVGFWEQVDRLQRHVRVIDYEIREIQVNNLALSGTVVLRLRCYSTDNPQMQTKILHQRWIYSQTEETWQVVDHALQTLIP